jgi:cardiolipin synthase A/B
MTWTLIVTIVYLLILALVCLRIIYETRSSTKTMAYLLFCVFVPVIGMMFYLAFGINYWRKKRYTKKMGQDEKMLEQLKKHIIQFNEAIIARENISENAELATMIIKDLNSPLTRHNKVKVLLNGEEKFPELMQAMEKAKHHIHIEYYIFEQDEIGKAVLEMLIKKANEGVEVRLIYDDFGSPSIKKKIEKRLRDAGAEVYPFYKVHFYLLANRINYRNHRKIVVIDGHTGFVGGINVSDKYINNSRHKKKLFWRDTHLRIDGPGVYYLQYLFFADWNFCCPGKLKPQDIYFTEAPADKGDTYVQVVGSGPDSNEPAVLFSILEAIYLAKEEILITTPYFIPGESILHALRIAALSGLSVKLLVPGICDSKLVNAASKAHYNDLLQAGVEIYIYQKGFVHSKTMVTDGKMSIVGTANMDIRSFELNFEVNAIVYDAAFSKKMRKIFFDDLKDAEQLDPELWYKRSLIKQLPEKLARIFSPSL